MSIFFLSRCIESKLFHDIIAQNDDVVVVATYPAIVVSYEQFDDASPFQTIGLDCVVPPADASANSNQLTAVVTYKTRYVD